MNEQNSGKSEQQRPFDLEERLSVYYGPPMRERPLPASSWQNLHLQLVSQKKARRRWRLRRVFPRKRARAEVPAFLLDGLAHVAYEARLPCKPAMLRCRFISPMQEAAVYSCWSGKPHIQLLLPIDLSATMGQVERDILLATGLARSVSTRKARYMIGRLALATIVLIAGLTLVLSWMKHFAFIGLPSTMILCAGAVWLWNVQARSIAFRADRLMVRWLGREQVCSGLHAWADRSRAPGRRRWGEPSLVERIERVYGTRVEGREKQLTMSR